MSRSGKDTRGGSGFVKKSAMFSAMHTKEYGTRRVAPCRGALGTTTHRWARRAAAIECTGAAKLNL
eukprot:6209181-Pleurochrysis_carterae.AAC.2